MSFHTTTDLSPITSTSTFTGISTQSRILSTILNNGSTVFNQTRTTITPNNFTWTPWTLPTLWTPPAIYTPPPIVFTDPGTNYYSISVYSYIIVLAVILVAALIAKLSIHRRQALLRPAAQRRIRARQQNVTVSTINNEQLNAEVGNNVGFPKDSDLPPAYDDVIKTYLNSKLQMQAEGGGVTEGMTMALSSVTIDTELGTTMSTVDLVSTTSVTDLAADVPMATMTTSTEITCHEPPSYESTFSNISNAGCNSIV